jgi:hypothetical protein
VSAPAGRGRGPPPALRFVPRRKRARRAGPSYARRSRKVCERSFAIELNISTLQTRRSPSVPLRRSASLGRSASAARGSNFATIAKPRCSRSGYAQAAGIWGRQGEVRTHPSRPNRESGSCVRFREVDCGRAMAEIGAQPRSALASERPRPGSTARCLHADGRDGKRSNGPGPERRCTWLVLDLLDFYPVQVSGRIGRQLPQADRCRDGLRGKRAGAKTGGGKTGAVQTPNCRSHAHEGNGADWENSSNSGIDHE